MSQKIEVVGDSKQAGCKRFRVFAGTGRGNDWKATGSVEVDLPTRKASFEEFVMAFGGEDVVRSLAMDARLVQIRAKINTRTAGNGTGAAESDLD
jgi:hypothetical protein